MKIWTSNMKGQERIFVDASRGGLGAVLLAILNLRGK